MRQMIFLEASDLEQMKAGNPISLQVNGSEFLLGMQETTKRASALPGDLGLKSFEGPFHRVRKEYPCPKCGKILLSGTGLKYHLHFSAEHRKPSTPRSPKPGKLPLYPCKRCNFVSTKPQGLKSHERSHALRDSRQPKQQEGKAT